MRLGPHGQQAEANRPVVAGRQAMVCAGHPLAAQAGMQVLQRGGTAADAALAVGAALGVVEPNMSGMGGDGFIMVYDRASGRTRVMNATGPAPARATREAYLPDGIPMKGIRSVSVPGLVSGWLQVQATYGRLTPAEALAPAIDLAETGFPISAVLARGLADDPSLAEFPASRAIFTRDGVPLRAGQWLIQKDLARSLQLIASEGEDGFYRGVIARALDAASRTYAGLIGADDLAGYRAIWQEPIATDYRGYTVLEAPPNSSGHVLLQMLNLLEGFDLPALPPNGADAIHLMVEAKKLAFADREAYLADPDVVDVPIEGLLD